MSYEAPQPSVGIHRIVFVLFRQPARHTVFAPEGRYNFNTRIFAQLHNLGSPVAASYFNCQRETTNAGGGTSGRRTWRQRPKRRSSNYNYNNNLNNFDNITNNVRNKKHDIWYVSVLNIVSNKVGVPCFLVCLCYPTCFPCWKKCCIVLKMIMVLNVILYSD